MPDLSVVIVSYNTRDELRNCLISLRDSRCRHSYSVTVVDNCSNDGSADMVRAEHPWVSQVIEADHNGGYAYANNLGLRAIGYGGRANASTRFALLLNPDTVLPPDALERLVDYLEGAPDVGAAGPRLVRQDGSLDKACRRGFPTPAVSFYHMAKLDRLFPRSPRFGRYNMTHLDEHQEADVDALVGACMLVRGEVLRQVGLFDEAFFMYGEDIDLCYRIKATGWRIVYHPQVTVLHIKGAASRKSSARAINAFYDAMRIFHRKYYRRRTPALLNWIIDSAISVMCWQALLLDRLRSPQHKRVASA